MKLGNWKVRVVVEPIVPNLDEFYHQRNRDPRDLVDFVITKYLDDEYIAYVKVYKGHAKPELDRMLITEFNKYFRKGK